MELLLTIVVKGQHLRCWFEADRLRDLFKIPRADDPYYAVASFVAT